MIQHRAHPTALGAFDQTLLLQTAMIHFNPPRRECQLLAFRFCHSVEVRCPVFRCAVCGTNPKYFDFSKSFEPAGRSISTAQPSQRNGLQFALPDSDLAVCFEPRQKMPPQRAHQFEIFDGSIPAIEAHHFRLKPRSKASKSISAKWSFLVLPSRSLSKTR